MILVDTSVWIDHLRAGDATLARLLEGGAVLGHPWVVGELALGHLHRRDEVLGLLRSLPQVTLATEPEVSRLIEDRALYGLGIGYVDAQLLAAALLTPDASLWTRDRHLQAACAGVGLAANP